MAFSYPPPIPPAQIDYSSGQSISLDVASEKWDNARFIIMDKYGSGYSGLGVITHENNEAIFRFAPADSEGRFSPPSSTGFSLGKYGTADNKPYPFLLMDKNGDELLDLVKVFRGGDGKTYAQAYLSTGGTGEFQKEFIMQQVDDTYISN